MKLYHKVETYFYLVTDSKVYRVLQLPGCMHLSLEPLLMQAFIQEHPEISSPMQQLRLSSGMTQK